MPAAQKISPRSKPGARNKIKALQSRWHSVPFQTQVGSRGKVRATSSSLRCVRRSLRPSVVRPSLLIPSSRRASLLPPCLDVVSSLLDPLHSSHGWEERSLRNYLKLESEGEKQSDINLLAAVGALTQVQWEEMRSSLQECNECVYLSTGG